MRKRGGTLYSKRELVNLEELGLEASMNNACSLESAKIDRSSQLSNNDSNDLFDSFGPICQDIKFERTFSGDRSSTSASTRESYCISEKDLMSWDEMFQQDEETKPQQTFNTLFVGASESGKRTLVKRILPAVGSLDVKKQKFDLIPFSQDRGSYIITHKLWVQETFDQSELEEKLFETYYKSCKTYVFVYDLSKPESLAGVEKIIGSIKKCVPADQFFGILIGNSRSDQERVIKLEEVKEVEERNGIQVSKILDLSSDNIDVAEIMELIEFQPIRYLY